MKKLIQMLQREHPETPEMIEVDSETNDRVVKGFIESRFPDAFKVSKNHVDGYLNIIRQNGGYEVEFLISCHDLQNNKVTYFNQYDDKVKGMLENLSSDEGLNLHITGKDSQEVLDKLHDYKNFACGKSSDKQPELKSNETKNNTISEYRENIELVNENGMHARPASEFIQLANKYESTVMLKKEGDDGIYNGKSLMQMLMMAAGPGSKLELIVTGSDAEKAKNELVKLFKEGESFRKY